MKKIIFALLAGVLATSSFAFSAERLPVSLSCYGDTDYNRRSDITVYYLDDGNIQAEGTLIIRRGKEVYTIAQLGVQDLAAGEQLTTVQYTGAPDPQATESADRIFHMTIAYSRTFEQYVLSIYNKVDEITRERSGLETILRCSEEGFGEDGDEGLE